MDRISKNLVACNIAAMVKIPCLCAEPLSNRWMYIFSSVGFLRFYR
ncbi:hypothetical protein COLSTE_02546 [Collinsella stercoris DSM 13279]|uniref:Uncharacterized protein n=1 Tax=Collinsella stercoris DSM 13279 TaxID=445975 RepID=B6GEK1_9ACTN|nr:hypothetical protein COLSTE_02546 [Collinsella stercoris DSM 13279]